MALSDWLFRSVQVKPTPTRETFPHHKKVPAGDFRFVALDVETACSDAASICQIGLACVQSDNQIQTYSVLVNPGTKFDRFNIQLHGIGPDTVSGALRFPGALEEMLPLLTRHHLIQHSNFDKQAIAAACRSSGISTPDLRWSDSVTIARRAWPELKGNGGHGLANLKRTLDLEFQHHDAGEDARAAALVVLHAEARLEMSFEKLVLPEPKKRRPANPACEANLSGPLVGSVAVFTGSLSMSREKAANLAALNGMVVNANVTKGTTHLIVGDQDLSVLAGHPKSSKHRRAEEMRAAGHPIQIVGETEFKGLLSNARAS